MQAQQSKQPQILQQQVVVFSKNYLPLARGEHQAGHRAARHRTGRVAPIR